MNCTNNTEIVKRNATCQYHYLKISLVTEKNNPYLENNQTDRKAVQ